MGLRRWRKRWVERIRWLLGHSTPREPGVRLSTRSSEHDILSNPTSVVELAESYRLDFKEAEQRMIDARLHLAGISRSSGWQVPSLKTETTHHAERQSVNRFDPIDLPSAFASRIQIEKIKIEFYKAAIRKYSLQIQFLNQISEALSGSRDRIIFLQREIGFFSREIQEHQKAISHFETGRSLLAELKKHQAGVDYFAGEEGTLKQSLTLERSAKRFSYRKKIRVAVLNRLLEQKKVYELELRLYQLYHVTFIGRRGSEEIRTLLAGLASRIEKVRNSLNK